MDDSPDDEAEKLLAQLAAVRETHGPEAVDLILQLHVSGLKNRLSRLQWVISLNALSTGLAGFCKGPYDWKVAKKSVAAADAATAPVCIGDRTEPFGELLRYEAALNIRIAADHMQGLAALIEAERSLLGAATLSRGIFEASIWAAALLDSEVSPEERLRRLIARRIVRLMAGIRQDNLLRESNPEGAAQTLAVLEVAEDEHGSHLDPETEIENLVTLAEGKGWSIKRRHRRIDLDDYLSIGDLVKTLGQRAGVEEYVWGNGSALAHGEHAPVTVALTSVIQDTMGGTAPAWMTRLHTAGSWAGPRLLLATLSLYTGRNHLVREFREMEQRFWETVS